MRSSQQATAQQAIAAILQTEARAGRSITIGSLLDRMARIMDPEHAPGIADESKKLAVANGFALDATVSPGQSFLPAIMAIPAEDDVDSSPRP